MSTPEPVNRTLKLFASLVDQFAQLEKQGQTPVFF